MSAGRVGRILIAVALLGVVSACGSDQAEQSDRSAGAASGDTGSAGRGVFEDNGLAQSDLMGFPEVKAARDALSPALAQAAKTGGDLACGLPRLPGASARESLPDRPGFVTKETPATVAAFYWAAADAAGGFAMVGATPAPFARIHLPDGRNCHVTAQATADGADFIVTDKGFMGLIGEGEN
ncbi:hypothetical protein ABS767_12715 [Sphingomonas sp. ST-64]|uniref:Lipoprotein n=1 Tax=Sphingomonas plantiphila TaxID=3163295 RepID=A0ABW8YNF7_9SPHN